jgi:hypothetical protein
MNKTRTVLSSALFALGLANAPAAFATDAVQINPDSTGGDPTLTVGSLGWNNGFAIAVNALPTGSGTINVGQVFTTFGQGALANFNNTVGGAIGGLNLNSTYEWTFVFGVQEIVTSTTANSAQFGTTGGGINFFNIYYDPTPDANVLDGTGFAGTDDSVLVLSGTFQPFNLATGIGVSNFTTSSTTGGALDQFNSDGNNYPNIQTVAGAGSFNLLASVTFSNPAFFIEPPKVISITANGFTNLPFLQTDPSSCYWNGAALSDAAGANTAPGTSPCLTNTLGAVNGIDGPNFAFETRPTSAFTVAPVPEPATLALLGIGLGALGWSVRRKVQ